MKMNLERGRDCLPGGAEEGSEESGGGEADARVGAEGVDGGLPKGDLHRRHEQVEAPDWGDVERERRRRQGHREQQLYHLFFFVFVFVFRFLRSATTKEFKSSRTFPRRLCVFFYVGRALRCPFKLHPTPLRLILGWLVNDLSIS